MLMMTVAAVAEVPVTRRLRETPNYLVVVHRNEQNPPGAGRAQPWWFVEGLPVRDKNDDRWIEPSSFSKRKTWLQNPKRTGVIRDSH